MVRLDGGAMILVLKRSAVEMKRRICPLAKLDFVPVFTFNKAQISSRGKPIWAFHLLLALTIFTGLHMALSLGNKQNKFKLALTYNDLFFSRSSG